MIAHCRLAIQSLPAQTSEVDLVLKLAWIAAVPKLSNAFARTVSRGNMKVMYDS